MESPGPPDLANVARQFCGNVALSGGSNDHRLKNDPPQEGKHMVRHTLDTLRRPFGNSYSVAVANSIVPSVPVENLEVMILACHEQ